MIDVQNLQVNQVCQTEVDAKILKRVREYFVSLCEKVDQRKKITETYLTLGMLKIRKKL